MSLVETELPGDDPQSLRRSWSDHRRLLKFLTRVGVVLAPGLAGARHGGGDLRPVDRPLRSRRPEPGQHERRHQRQPLARHRRPRSRRPLPPDLRRSHLHADHLRDRGHRPGAGAGDRARGGFPRGPHRLPAHARRRCRPGLPASDPRPGRRGRARERGERRRPRLRPRLRARLRPLHPGADPGHQGGSLRRGVDVDRHVTHPHRRWRGSCPTC